MNSCLLSHVHHSSSFQEPRNFKSDCITEHMFRCRITQLGSRMGQSIGRKIATVSWQVSSFAVKKKCSLLTRIYRQTKCNEIIATPFIMVISRMYIPLGKLLHSVVSSRNNRLSKSQIVNHGLSLVYYAADKGRLATIIADSTKWKKGIACTGIWKDY